MSAIVRLPNGKQAYLVQIDGDSIEIGDVHLDSSPENPVFTQLTGSYVEHRGLSADTKPTSGNNVGDVFFEIDTTDAYMWDGASWELI